MTGRGKLRRQTQARGRRCCGKARERFSRVAAAACLVLLWLVPASTAFSRSPSVDKILRKTGDVYSHLQNYHIVATREKATSFGQSLYSRRFTVTLDAAGQGHVRMDLADGNLSVLIVSDGTTTWQYAASGKEYTEREAGALLKGVGAQEPGAGPTGLLGQIEALLVERFATLWRLEKAATLEGKSKIKFQGRKVSCYRVHLRIMSYTDDLWIDRSNFLVLEEKLNHIQKIGSVTSHVTNTLRMKEVDLHPARSTGFFTFTAPAGVRRVTVLDLPGLRQSAVGAKVEDFTLPDDEGKQVSLSDFQGKTVLLSFWATWCPPCRMELPVIQKIYEQGKGKNVVVLAVDDEDPTTIRSFLKHHHYGFMALIDRKHTLFRRFAVHSLPTVLVINDNGIVVRQIVGWGGPQDLLAAVKAGEQ